jgi:hypothetical protein
MPASNPHSRPWHADSIFGEGPRRKLNREARAQWEARVILWFRSKNRDLRLTGDHVQIAWTLLRMLGQDGRLDPSHATLADYSGRGVGCVKEALRRLKRCGLLMWARRLWRPGGGRVKQNSNAYMLTLGEPPRIQADRCEATSRPQTNTQEIKVPVSEAMNDLLRAMTPEEVAEHRAGLAKARAVMEARMQTRG